MSEKRKLKRLLSPFGVAVWPKITRPDTKYVKTGEYSTKLRLPTADQKTQDFIAELQKQLDEFLNAMEPKTRKTVKKVADIYQVELNDEGDETGFVLFKFKLNAQIEKDGEVIHLAPMVYSASNELIEGTALKNLKLWGGSIIRVRAEVNPYFNQKDKEAGLSLRMKDVQIKKLSKGGGSPFDAVEGDEPEDDGMDNDDDTPAATDEKDF